MSFNIDDLELEIANLPKGYISNKKIGNKIRHYLQYKEDDKLISKYIPDSEYKRLNELIEYRKKLQSQLKVEKTLKNNKINEINLSDVFSKMNIVYGELLKSLYSKMIVDYEKRDCYHSLLKYLNSDKVGRICILYGLRRTGKTTLMFQAIAQMAKEEYEKSVYIKCRKGQTIQILDNTIKKLQELGFKYIFIDEVTLLDDFVDNASILSDIYAAYGMKIVLSGTDSLGFYFARNEELYDRAYLIHTTWIPFKEYSRLLKIDDIDEYIRYGGTLRAGEYDFDDEYLKSEEISFNDDETTRRYIDTAICKNIQHSLKCYDDGNHFRHLYDLYEAKELTNVINRIIENMNHKFVLKVIDENFKSNDLGISKKNLIKDRNQLNKKDILEYINVSEVTKRLMDILEIKNKDNRKIEITSDHIIEIEEYLKVLDLISDCQIRYANNSTPTTSKLILQPGMRYSQAHSLIYSLKKDTIFSTLSEKESDYICNKILDEVKGRMLEEIVLYETMKVFLDKRLVFKLMFSVGEFDMVIYNKDNNTCLIYEIKHSKMVNENQVRHLKDMEKCQATEKLYGKIVGKYVLYKGESFKYSDEISYLNVEEYLKNIQNLT